MGRLIAHIEVQVLEDDAGLPLPGLLLGRGGLQDEVSLLEAEGAFGQPGVAGHFGDQFALHGVGGLVFAREDLEATTQAVSGAVLRDGFVTFGGARPGTLF